MSTNVVKEQTPTGATPAATNKQPPPVAEPAPPAELPPTADTTAAPEPPPAGAEAPPPPSIEELQAQLEAALAEAAKNLDGWQRATAELANYKKRQDEQAARRRDDITGRIIAELFPALDDLDLAFENVPQSASEQEASWIEGFKLVQRKLIKILTAHNVQPINAEGEFDPSLHEAVTHEDHPDYDSNTIIAELRKGYKLGNRVLRPSLVRVAQ